MPHICCRDKNAIAMRSQLLGAHINNINNFLVITGDPIPSVVRASVKSVFNFDSVGLMNIISDMNQEQFADKPVIYGGAINQGRVNFNVELTRVKKKMEAGATFFMTQPVFTDEDISRLRQIKEETGARILCGIMPFVSLRNATFMKNEMTGINVTDEILSRYRADMTKEELCSPQRIDQIHIDLLIRLLPVWFHLGNGFSGGGQYRGRKPGDKIRPEREIVRIFPHPPECFRIDQGRENLLLRFRQSGIFGRFFQ